MAAINRMGSGRETVSPAANPWAVPFTKPGLNEEASSAKPVLETFTCFGELPSELRVKIWNHVCFHPRNVDISSETLGTVRICEGTYVDVHKFFSHALHPAVLHVSRESREEGMKHYQLEFGSSYTSSIINVSTPPRIYVNFACDRLCLLKPECLESELAGQFYRFIEVCRKNKIRSLAVNVFEDQHWPIVEFATLLNSLEELVLFDCNMNIDLESTGVSIFFILLKGWRTDLYQDPAERQLEIARRDFLALFDMHIDGLNYQRTLSSKEQLPWKAPVVELSRLVIDGKPEANTLALNAE
jgi:hypothetical protein